MLYEEIVNIINDINNNSPQELNADDPFTETNYNNTCFCIKKLTEALEILNNTAPNLPPIGYIHIRLPGTPLPEDLWPHPTAKWVNHSTKFPGVFLRVEGENAALFSESEGVNYTEGVGKDGGGQTDAMHTHTHPTWERSGHTSNMTAGGSVNTRSYEIGAWGRWETSKNASGRTTSETRPKNITVQIYKRIA